MKTLYILLFISSFTLGQIKEAESIEKIEIGSIRDMSSDVVKMERWGENEYVIFYQDQKFKQITDYKSFHFKDVDGTLDSFYNTLFEGIKSKEKIEKTLELPDDILTLKFGKMMGSGYVEIYHSPKNAPNVVGVVQWIDEKRLNKLFGKDKKKK